MSTGNISDVHSFSSGAKSSEEAPRFDLVPRALIRRVSPRFKLGAERHGEGNYKRGFLDPDWVRDRFNHAQIHLDNLLRKFKLDPNGSLNIGDDDLAALGWFVAMMAERDECIGGEDGR